jgi:predicted DNA-binding WGR domain protein
MMITLYRTDSTGAAHYYTLHDRQGQLFPVHSFTAAWGRNLSSSREKVYEFETRAEMDAKIRAIIREKIIRGYKVLYSYLRPGEMKDVRPVLKKYAVR